MVALLLMTTSPVLADECATYVSESNPSEAIEVAKGYVIVRGDDGMGVQHILYDVPGHPELKEAEWINPNNPSASDTITLRFEDVNGRPAIIADMQVYYQLCHVPTDTTP
jgi:hypothetical protein